MAVSSEMAEMEAQLAASGQTVKALCIAAGVNQSTWTRWKSGLTTPNMATWGKVREAFEGIITATQPEPRVA